MGTKGQLTMPCVFAHISQVLIDAFLCSRLGRRKDQEGKDPVAATIADSALHVGEIERSSLSTSTTTEGLKKEVISIS